MKKNQVINKLIKKIQKIKKKNLIHKKKMQNRLNSKIFPSAYEALKDIKSGSSLLLSGFGIVGITEHLSDIFSKMPVKDITLITNTPGLPGFGLGKHLDAK